jgi:hypothetical protein
MIHRWRIHRAVRDMCEPRGRASTENRVHVGRLTDIYAPPAENYEIVFFDFRRGWLDGECLFCCSYEFPFAKIRNCQLYRPRAGVRQR